MIAEYESVSNEEASAVLDAERRRAVGPRVGVGWLVHINAKPQTALKKAACSLVKHICPSHKLSGSSCVAVDHVDCPNNLAKTGILNAWCLLQYSYRLFGVTKALSILLRLRRRVIKACLKYAS